MNPGWYPDPFSHGTLRWWDGTTWTAHTAPAQPTPSFYRLDPNKDLTDEHNAGRRAAIAMVVGAVLGAVSEFVGAASLGSYFRDAVRSADRLGTSGATTTPALPAGFLAFELVGIAAFVVQILVMIWLYRAASFARKAGLAARRDPIWGVLGFFVPVVNFWFPYQVAADSFPPTDTRRRSAGRWWTWYLISSLSAVVVFVAALFSTAVGVAFAAAGAVAYGLAAFYGRAMIAALGGAHDDLLRALADR